MRCRKGEAPLDLSNVRPAKEKRQSAIRAGMEWNADAKVHNARFPYQDSSDQVRDRLGENLPTSKNGSMS